MKHAILLVDDDPGVLKLTGIYLKRAGISATFEAHSGVEALALWESHREEIGTVITDLHMPAMNGDELARDLKTRDPHLRIIFMSGSDPENFESCFKLVPGKNFIAKPFCDSDLQKLVPKKIASISRS